MLGRRNRFIELMDEQEKEVAALRERDATLVRELEAARVESAARLGRITHLESSLAA